MIFGVFLIMTDQLFCALLPAKDVVTDEIHEFLRMRSVPELEIDTLTVPFVCNTCTFLLRVMLEHQLLQE